MRMRLEESEMGRSPLQRKDNTCVLAALSNNIPREDTMSMFEKSLCRTYELLNEQLQRARDNDVVIKVSTHLHLDFYLFYNLYMPY
jgi:hypothetical protein